MKMNSNNGSLVPLFFIVNVVILPGCGGGKPVELKKEEITKKYEKRSSQGRLLARRLQNRIETVLVPRSFDKRYFPYQVQEIVDDELFGKSFEDIKSTFLEAYCLNMPYLVNAVARVIVHTNAHWAQQMIHDQLDTIIPSALHIYLKKHLQLQAAQVIREYSIADLIAENPSETIPLQGEDGYNLSFEGKSLTSLYGITYLDRIENCGEITDVSIVNHLHLNGNYILDHEHDPDFPHQPFEQFHKLRTLSLDENLLTCLPSTIFTGLNTLEELYLNDNKLAYLPEDVFLALTHLNYLEISHNHLERLPCTIFQGLKELRWLGLNHNQLTNVSGDMFKGLTKLFLLEMAHNQLADLPADIFQGLMKLEILDLSYNRLAFLPENIFQALSQLKSLDLIANQLTRLPKTIFQVVTRSGVLRLSGNLLSEEQKNKISDFCSDKDCELLLS